MRKLITNTFVSLDGVMQAPGGPDEDPTGGFAYGVHGSGNLIQTLLKGGLIDEFRVWTFPVLLGRGKRLFGEGTMPAGLQLFESKTSTTGVVIARYEPRGEVPIGSFEFDTPTEAEVARRKRLAEEG